MTFETLFQAFPIEANKLALVFALSFLIGLEREEHKGDAPPGYTFGGIRTFPLIGLTGYALALLTNGNGLALALGFLVIGALMLASYLHKVQVFRHAGLTTEISGLLTYLLGALVYQNLFWIATALVVLAVLLLELKSGLEGLARRLPADQVLTLTKFLLLSVVILPVLPNSDFTPFQINPFRTWLVVVAISAVSYGSYILQLLIGSRSGVLGSALLGGAYSSTVATIALAKRSRETGTESPNVFAGAILSASGVMYLRLGILLSIFSTPLRTRLAASLFALAVIALVIGVLEGVLETRRSAKKLAPSDSVLAPKNPLELRTALLFAMVFLAMKALTGWVLSGFGTGGVYGLALATGVTDVDPFIMGMTQSAGTTVPVDVAAGAVLIAAASNNLIKGIYAWFFADRETGRRAMFYLVSLAVTGLLPLVLF